MRCNAVVAYEPLANSPGACPPQRLPSSDNRPEGYTMTEHRNAGAPQRDRRGRTIDIHAHWYPAEWLRLVERDGPAGGPRLGRSANGYAIRTERMTNAFDEAFVDLPHRIETMDRIGVDVHALSLTTPMVYWASPALGLALSQAYNDAVAAAHERY